MPRPATTAVPFNPDSLEDGIATAPPAIDLNPPIDTLDDDMLEPRVPFRYDATAIPLTDAAKTGSRREILEALRDKICKTLDDCISGRDIAALSKRLLEVCAELDSLPVEDVEQSPLLEAQNMVADDYDEIW